MQTPSRRLLVVRSVPSVTEKTLVRRGEGRARWSGECVWGCVSRSGILAVRIQ